MGIAVELPLARNSSGTGSSVAREGRERARGRAGPASLSDTGEDGGDVHASSESPPPAPVFHSGSPAPLGHTPPGEQERVALCVTGSSGEGGGSSSELWGAWD